MAESRGTLVRRVVAGSVRAKLRLLSLVLVVVPGIFFAWIAIGSGRQALEHAIGRQLAEVAQDVAERVETEIDRIADDVRTWSGEAAVRALATSDVGADPSSILDAHRASEPALRALSVADGRGRIVASSDPARVGTMVADRDWWPEIMRGESATGIRADRSEGALELVAPLMERGHGASVVGALVAEYPWEQVDPPLQHLQHDLAVLELDVGLIVLDGSGRVVAGGWWEEPSNLAGENLQQLGWITPELGRAGGRASYRREAAANALVGYAAIAPSRLGLVALAAQPLATALAPMSQLARRLVLALVGVLLVGLALAAVLADRLTRPVRELTQATRELARTGELPTPVAVRTRDEIGELTASFNRMAADLKRAQDDLLSAAKFAFVGELAAGMAHEIRTPLGIVRSSAQLLGRSLAPTDPRGGELVEMIVGEVDRLDRVVSGLLELARPHEPRLEPVPLAPILARALDFVAIQALERGIALHRELPSGGRRALCDPEQIHQVALNLVMNALQILPRGGSIRVRALSHDRSVGFEVIDDGPGIPPELQEMVFLPFFTRRPGGTGLGLALVRRIVESHRGTVTVESAVGRGTTFRIALPVAEEGA